MPVAFERAFLPYDGSDAAAVALEYAINLAHRGAQLTIVNVVDWTPAYSQAGMVRYVGDSTTQLDALDSEGRLELDTAELRCTEADVYAIKQLIHDQPVPGIVNAAEDMRTSRARRHPAQRMQHNPSTAPLSRSIIPSLRMRPSRSLSALPKQPGRGSYCVTSSTPLACAKLQRRSQTTWRRQLPNCIGRAATSWRARRAASKRLTPTPIPTSFKASP